MWTDKIEKIFLINTDDEIGRKRLPLATNELDMAGIPFKRYEAIKNDKDGAKGLLQTMRILFEENQDAPVLVFEDDIKFLRKDVNAIMDEIVLPPDWHCLYLGCNLLVPPVKILDNVLRIHSAYSSHAVVYSRRATALILSLWNEEKPYDNFLMQKIQPYGNCYCTFPMLCSQRKGVSSIFEYKPAIQIGIQKYYNVETHEIDWGKMMEERFKEFTIGLL